jgi:hypothetical protein
VKLLIERHFAEMLQKVLVNIIANIIHLCYNNTVKRV